MSLKYPSSIYIWSNILPHMEYSQKKIIETKNFKKKQDPAAADFFLFLSIKIKVTYKY